MDQEGEIILKSILYYIIYNQCSFKILELDYFPIILLYNTLNMMEGIHPVALNISDRIVFLNTLIRLSVLIVRPMENYGMRTHNINNAYLHTFPA